MLVFSCCLSTRSSAASSPVVLDQRQFDALVESISKSVARKLTDEGLVTVGPSAQGSPITIATGDDDPGLGATVFVARTQRILSAYPSLWSSLQRVGGSLGASGNGGRSPLAFLAILGATVCVAWCAETAVRVLSWPVRRWLVHRIVEPAELWLVAILALLDGLAVLCVWFVTYGATGACFGGTEPQSSLATMVLASFLSLRLYLFAFRLFLRPNFAIGRLAEMSDADASAVYRRIALAVLVLLAARTTVRFLAFSATPQDTIGAASLVNDVLALAVFIWAACRSREAVAHWFGTLTTSSDGHGAATLAARHWLHIAVPFFVLLAAANAYGAVVGRPDVPSALLLTLNVAVGLLLLETLLGFVRRTTFADAKPGGSGRPRPYDLVARCLRMAVLVIAGVTVTETWVVDVLGLIGPEQWQFLTRSGFRAGITIFAAYVAWQLMGFVAESYAPAEVEGGHAGTDLNASATSFATLIPLIKVFLGGIISIVAVLVVLSEAGVNITPLLAGASVFGLAISIGSQTLVKDVVSGVFYLADDAFRVGEYIDCGKAKGTVEGFTMRSIRLRHQNGSVHTIPFGQLGQITNFSRGWSVVKFNLRFARDTDLETLRKLVKRIGQEMLDDPDLKTELIQPLKMMGVAEITDNALVMRFKFTVRPDNPGMVQRNAMIRMLRAFPEAGIAFSNGTAPLPPAAAVTGKPPETSLPDVHILLPAA